MADVVDEAEPLQFQRQLLIFVFFPLTLPRRASAGGGRFELRLTAAGVDRDNECH